MATKSANNFNYSLRNDLIQQIIAEGLGQGVFPGCCLSVGSRGQTLFHNAYGTFFPESEHDKNQRVTIDTVYDLGTLSSVIGTVTTIWSLINQNFLSFEDQVIRFQQSFSVHGKAAITVEDLLFHLSGLASEQNYHEEISKDSLNKSLGLMTSPGAKEYVYNRINRARLRSKPHEVQRFSSVGMILLGRIIENLTGKSLDDAVTEHVFKPLKLNSTGYINLNRLKTGIRTDLEKVAPTEDCAWRKKQLWGEVQDDVAWSMGGVAGHAGIFSTVEDLGLFCEEILAAYRGNSELIKPEVLQQAWSLNSANQGLRYVGGWEKAHKENQLLNCGFSEQAIGFCSNSGCLIWIDPEVDLHVVFLSNAHCPSRNNKRIMNFMPQLLKAIRESF